MNDILPEFQKFIAQRKLAPENQIPLDWQFLQAALGYVSPVDFTKLPMAA